MATETLNHPASVATVSERTRCCPICMEPATHRIASEGWDGIGCQRHAEHAAVNDPTATITPLAA